MSFLDGYEQRALTLPDAHGIQPVGLVLGQGPNALEVAITRSPVKPTSAALRSVWRARLGGRATPLLLVALYGDKAAICGPVGDQPPTFIGLEPAKVERVCSAALLEPDRHAALRFLASAIPELESSASGLRNEGLFATHELINGVPTRDDWGHAVQAGVPLLRLRDRELLRSLGFTLEQTPGREYVLRAANTRVALALLLDRNESPDMPSPLFSGVSPISQALAKADTENLDYVIVISGPQLRLYPARTGVGTGQRGRSETFAEVHLDLLSESQAGYLWLLFSAGALQKSGSVGQILESSSRYAVELGARLRERIYVEVVPPLAQALMQARNVQHPTASALRETYQMALVVLFRLLFIAYAEDKELLPYRTNDLYRARSLKQKANDLTKHLREERAFSVDTTAHWEEVERLFRAVDRGNPEWGVPQYNGGLFTVDAAVSPVGAAIAQIRLTDHVFGPILAALLVDRTTDGWGPVDFRSLGVREFGTIYEGLLENELAIADTDLTTEVKDKQEQYRPARPKDEVRVRRGQAFLHSTSGTRKSTGSYFTKHFAVEHLLEQGLEPALVEHMVRLDALPDRQAGESFFDFRVADITMGSAHFLVAAVDRIERAFSGYLAKRRLPEVMDELQRLRQSAIDSLASAGGAVEIEDTQLLRRQIARRCIYGVDLNPIAVELARLALWIHTFVPGLPLSFLDHNLVPGNSLVGIATLEEASDELRKLLELPLFVARADEILGPARDALLRLARSSDANAAEIAAARAASSEARRQVAPAAALFDVLAASRISQEVRDGFAQHGTHWLTNTAEIPNSGVHKSAIKALEAIPPFHFPIAFPEVFLRDRPGFDLILGNPPWEEATVEEDRFWTRHHPGFHSLQQQDQEALKRKLRRDRPDLLHEMQQEIEQANLLRSILVTGPFPGMGTGDPDLYKAASWRFWSLVRAESGRVSVVLPRSAFAAKGSTEFRKTLLSAAEITDLTQLLNKQNWVFPDVHPQYTFVLASWRRSAPSPDESIPVRGPYSSLAKFNLGVAQPAVLFPVAGILSWTDSASLPLLPSDESAEVFVQIRKAPRLDHDDGSGWRARPHAELHATNDKKLMTFTEEPPRGFWPVFKGESFDLWEQDTGAYYAWADPKKVIPELQKSRLRSAKLARSAFHGMSADSLRDPGSLPCHDVRIAFRDVTRATDTRTIRTALLPAEVFITNAAPYFVWLRGDHRDQAYLLGMLSSLCLDWYARRFVEIHLNYHVLNPFPIPRPARTSTLWKAAVALAGRLSSTGPRFAKWAQSLHVKCGPIGEDQKNDMIRELDAVVAHLYGLREDQFRHIFETFHDGWDYAQQMESTIEHFRLWQTRL